MRGSPGILKLGHLQGTLNHTFPQEMDFVLNSRLAEDFNTGLVTSRLLSAFSSWLFLIGPKDFIAILY